MKQMITEELLKQKGYRRYEDCGSDYADFFYQKRITDTLGTKFFIEIIHYPKLPNTPTETWSACMHINEPACRFQIHRPTDVDEVELKCNAVWFAASAIHYELN